MFRITVTFLAFLTIIGCQNPDRKPEPVNIIFDTDIGPDYDDVGAITLLHAFADSGRVNILATVASTKYPAVTQVLDVFNTYFKKPDLPIGVPKGNAVTDKDFQNWSDTIIVRYPHSVKSNDEIPDAVKIYRKILATQPDTSVTVVTVGFLTNLANLLDSPGDEFSDLTGGELVKKKVKRLVSMAGGFPKGREYNVWKDAAAAKKTFDSWPTPIIFSGVEIGEKIKTGLPLVENENIKNSPVKDVYRISFPLALEDSAGRMSWDQTAVLVAVKGPSPYFELVQGKIIMNNDGSNTWDASGKQHFYLVQKMPINKLEEVLNGLMGHLHPSLANK
jgi:pyrimidine-specific ribonucleoside hydrolase